MLDIAQDLSASNMQPVRYDTNYMHQFAHNICSDKIPEFYFLLVATQLISELIRFIVEFLISHTITSYATGRTPLSE
jgi:hypothetical protein